MMEPSSDTLVMVSEEVVESVSSSKFQADPKNTPKLKASLICESKDIKY